MLEKEFDYYLLHQNELLSKYSNKYLVIKSEKVVASFDTNQQAYDFATATFVLGTFLIQFCEPGDMSYSQTFHSQVIFSTL